MLYWNDLLRTVLYCARNCALLSDSIQHFVIRTLQTSAVHPISIILSFDLQLNSVRLRSSTLPFLFTDFRLHMHKGGKLSHIFIRFCFYRQLSHNCGLPGLEGVERNSLMPFPVTIIVAWGLKTFIIAWCQKQSHSPQVQPISLEITLKAPK